MRSILDYLRARPTRGGVERAAWRMRAAVAVMATLGFAAGARGDNLVNKDPAGSQQDSPSICVTYHDTYGYNLVAFWVNRMSGFPGIGRFSCAISQTDPPSFERLEEPPPPAGYYWWHCPIVRAPAIGQDSRGTFYLFGQLRTLGTPSGHAVGFLRGNVTSTTSVTWSAPQVLQAFIANNQTTYHTGNMAMDVDPQNGTIHLLYGNMNTSEPTNALVHLSSTNGGDTWSAPAWIGVDSTTTEQPEIKCGPVADELSVLWSERTTGKYSNILGMHSTNGGAAYGPVTTVMRRANQYQGGPGDIGYLGAGFSSTLDRSTGASNGSVVFGATCPMDLSTDTFPDLATAPQVVESEPNDTPAASTPIPNPGSVIRGTISTTAPPDTDYFALPMTAGQTMDVLMDSTSASLGSCGIEWIGPDGRSILCRTYWDRLGFTAPSGGTYFLRLSRVTTATGAYRVRLTGSRAPAPGARDQRDVVLSRLSGGSWTGAQINTGTTLGYEESGIALTWNLDGYLYATWTEFDVAPGRSISRQALSRSSDGGATWSAPVSISGVPTDWMEVQSTPAFVHLHMGTRSDAQTDGLGMYFVWTDGRNGDPDVFFRGVRRQIFLEDPTPFTATAHPGETVNAARMLRNGDDLFPFGVRIWGKITERDWGALPTNSAALGPGETAHLTYTFTVPDTAAPGTVSINVTYGSDASKTDYASATLQLQILGPAGVEDPRTARFALEPVAPNPARSSAKVDWSLSRAGHARLAVYDLNGRRVRMLVQGDLDAGQHHRAWDGTNDHGAPVSPGMFFIRMEAEGRVLSRRFVWLR